MAISDFSKTLRLKRYIFIVQVVLILFLVVGANYIGMFFFKRYDLSRLGNKSLTSVTLGHIQHLSDPVNIIVTWVDDTNNDQAKKAYKNLQRLLKEYEYASSGNASGYVKCEFINPFQQKTRAEELARLYKIEKENCILVVCQGRCKEILLTDLYEVKKNDIKAFKGEQMITSAIIEVSQSQSKKIYFTQGHGEMTPHSVHPLRGISQLSNLLELQNYKWELLDLTENTKIPSDADLVVIAGPQAPFLEYEVQQLSTYLSEKNGHLLVFLSVNKDHGLDDLLYQWGIRADNWIVVDTGVDFQNTSGDFLIRRFAEHPITQQLIDYQLGLVWGLMRPIQPDAVSQKTIGLYTQSLLASSNESWAKPFSANMQNLAYDTQLDIKGPISLAVLSERKIDSSLDMHLDSGKLIVFGNSDCIANHKINALGNRILVLNAVHWCTQKNHLLQIAPQPIEYIQLILSKQEVYALALKLMLVPIFISIVGLGVFWIRRR